MLPGHKEDRLRTARPWRDVLENTLVMEGRPLRIAKVETALRDIRRVGRNLHLVNETYYREILEEQAETGRTLEKRSEAA